MEEQIEQWMAPLYRKARMECGRHFPGAQNNRRKSDLPKKRVRQRKKLHCFDCIRIAVSSQKNVKEGPERQELVLSQCSLYKQPQEAATIMVQWDRNRAWHAVLVCNCTPTVYFE